MAIAYFDCFAGAAGDMIVAALLDAGADFDAFRRQIAKLPLGPIDVRLETVYRQGMAGRRFLVESHDPSPPHRHLSDILAMIDSADLSPRCTRQAKDIFTRLGQAEAQVHGIDIEKVHFHEVGAADSIVDIVGAVVALELLDIETVSCSPLPLGRGTVTCDHGVLPVPSPATVRLLTGVKTVPGADEAEMTTPTAAAVLRTLAESFGPPPAMEIAAVGYGAGARESGTLPNLLRVLLGRPSDDGAVDSVVELSANLDDCTGEVLGATLEKLLSAGCLDAWATPAFTKKSRPAWVLSALCRPGDVSEAERILFTETTTFGVRRRVCARTKLQRAFQTVETPYGPVRVKVGRYEGRIVTASPEFSDCRQAAESHGVPVRRVLDAAAEAFRKADRP